MNRILRSNRSRTLPGFTIIELLMVVVIIGILATIVIIFYVGTATKAIDTSLQSDLKSASTQLELDKTTTDQYPSTKENANNGKGLKPSTGTIFDYSYSSNSNSYCLTATKENRSFYLDSANRFPRQGSCQTGSFARTWGGINSDSTESIVQTNDSGYAVAGFTYSFGAGSKDSFIAKYNPDGTLAWNKTWGGTNTENAMSVKQTSDNGYIVTGSTSSYGAGDSDAFIIKYTADGSLSWSRTLGGTNTDYGDKVIQTSDNNYVMIGETKSYGAGGGDAFIAKFTSSGDLLWNTVFGGTNIEYARDLIQISDGSYVIDGYTRSYGAGGYDAYVAKFTGDGTLLWNRTWGGADNEYANAISKTDDSGYIMSGGTYSYGAGSSDAFIAKFTSDGTLAWNRTWGGIGWENSYSTIKKDDGNAIIGQTDSFGVGDSDAYIAKFTGDGTLAWNRTWGGAAYDGGFASSGTDDGGYIVSGQTINYGAANYNGFMLKYDSSGYVNNCPTSMCQTPAATITNPTITINNPTIATSNTTMVVNNPTVSESSPTAIVTNPVATEITPNPAMTINFSAQELYVAYPGVSANVCKQWTVPNGKLIKGFKVSQVTEANYDFFIVYLDNVRKYDMSGIATNKFIDTSSTPGTVLKACMVTDEAAQDGYGGEVTGVIYN